MRLTHLHAENFLSFAGFALEDLDPGLTVIVGPNAAGKTNVVRMIQLAASVLRWTEDSQRGDLARQYAGAIKWDAQPPGFAVKVGIQLTTDAERRMLKTWLRAALLTSYARGQQQELVKSADAHLMDAVDDQAADLFAAGSIAIQFEALPAPRFAVGYEFTAGDQTYCYAIRAAGGQGGIAHGSLAEQSQHQTQSRDRSRLLTDDPAGDQPPLDFNRRRLLPQAGELIPLDIQEVYGWQRTETARELRRVFGALAEDRSYMLDLFLTRVLSQIVFVGDDRTTAREDYRAHELMLPSTTGGVQDTPLELLRLKLGDTEERQRFQRAQQHFAGLTDASFDLRLLQTPAASDEENPQDTQFAIQVEVTDEPATVPLAFAGAGRWEALILSRALASEGAVTILDEPALNLHPTLQRRLLSAIRQGSSQTLLITHSPFLVPADSRREIQKIIRLRRDETQTTAHRVSSEELTDPTAKQGIKLHHTFINSTDARALLFASAALLVEGATEVAALEIWLPALAAAHGLPSPQDLNLAIASVNGDGDLALYAAYLDAFAVPWAILCDGKALRLDCKKALKKWLPDTRTPRDCQPPPQPSTM